MKYLAQVLLCCFLFSSPLLAQLEGIKYDNEVYLDYIKTVNFSHQGLSTSLPIIDLNSSGVLALSFDDLEGGDKTYRYQIIHCDRNWVPTDMDDLNYVEGFQDEDIQETYYSSGTVIDYTHYKLTLPNEDIKWTISGNFILAIYEDEYEPTLAITRRFLVAEKNVSILSEVRKPIDVMKLKTHHELQFTIQNKTFNISNPLNEIEVAILQNGKWNDAITNVKPKFVNGTNIEFRYTDKFIFPALKEFRFADLRTTKSRSRGVHSIEINMDDINVLLEIDEKRTFNNFLSEADVNGGFVIETLDDNNDWEEAEYMNVIFSLDAIQPILDKEVYLFGAFTDWQLKESHKMVYDYDRNLYLASIELKQGFYDYIYVTKDKQGKLDYEIEGNWYQTENDYTILVYYTEFGSQYDRLIGVQTFNSNL